VAIVQISRITNRKGLTENLPQLAGAELGWCVDSRRLFIGNGLLEEGAPIIGNTEILTEFSDITVLSDYTYEDIAVGYAAQTGPTPSTPVVRTVQAKLDDFANVRDFGAVGDGVADDTEAINRAMFQLYCRENNPQVRRTLYFPAGVYRVNNTVIIPSYAKLVGEGAQCSIIQLDTDDNPLPAYIARYGDSLQQTGANIGNNGAISPRNIEISSMTFRTTRPGDGFLVESAAQCWFDSVNFIGPTSIGDLLEVGYVPVDSAVRFSSTPSLITNQITFDKCRFSGFSYAFNTTQATRSVTVSNSKFDTLYQGIVVSSGDTTGFRAVHNIFDDIYAQGIVYGQVNINASAYNAFYNVGNAIGSVPTFPVISISNNNNISIGDMFERTDDENNQIPRVEVGTGTTVSGGTQLQIGRYAVTNGKTIALANDQTNQPAFVVNGDDIRAFSVNYTIIRSTTVRHGVLTVVSGPSDDSTSDTSYTDDYSENFDTGVTLGATKSGDLVTVRYTTTDTGDSAAFVYSISYLA
jgi:hypothetical protein